jgi:predicted small lipoprotein YifL
MTVRSLIITLVLSSAALAGCGKTGLLEQPAPLVGDKAKADYQAQKQAEADAKASAAAARKAQNTAPIVDSPETRPLTNAPYGPPLPAQVNDPFAPGPQGALPNPGTAPIP